MKSAKTLSGAIILAALLGTTACSAGGTDGIASETPAGDIASETPAGDIALRMTVWTSNEAHLSMFNSIADAYMADHPEVTSIDFEPLPFADYTTTLTTQIAGGNAPDLAWVLESTAPDFVDSGALLPLDDALGAVAGYDLPDLSASATELWRDESGALMAYPFSTSPFVVFTNNDLLAQAGLPTGAEIAASRDYTWESVDAMGSTVAKATGKSGFVVRDFDYSNWEYLSTVWDGWDASPWSADGAQCEFDSPEMVKAFEFLHSAAFESGSMPGPGTTADFFAGEAAFTVTQISRASLLAEKPFNWDLIPLPAGPSGEYSVIGQAGIGVLAKGGHPDVSADFLAFFTNPENSALLSQYFPPPRESQLNAATLATSNPLLTEAQLDQVVVPGILTGEVRPVHSNAAEISQTVRSGLDSLWVEDADIQGTLTSLCGSLSGLLEQ